MLIDLHSHSTSSDGRDSPAELIAKADKMGIRYLALTDHDTLAGLDEAARAAQSTGVTFIRGVELEIEWPHVGEFHLLGLNLGPNDKQLQQALKMQREGRRERNEQILALMRKAGISITYEDLQARSPSAVLGRPHIAQYLVDIGKVKHYQQAFDLYLAYGRPFCLPKKALPLEYALQTIHSCEGKAVIAHPMSLCLSWRNLDARLTDFKAMGIDGLEAYHSTCSAAHGQRLRELADKHGLLISGGSDYHGEHTKNRGILGHYHFGRRAIPEDVLKIIQ